MKWSDTHTHTRNENREEYEASIAKIDFEFRNEDWFLILKPKFEIWPESCFVFWCQFCSKFVRKWVVYHVFSSHLAVYPKISWIFLQLALPGVCVEVSGSSPGSSAKRLKKARISKMVPDAIFEEKIAILNQILLFSMRFWQKSGSENLCSKFEIGLWKP